MTIFGDGDWATWSTFGLIMLMLLLGKLLEWVCSKVFSKAATVLGFDFDRYIYIPYQHSNMKTKKIEDKIITIRKPCGLGEWCFLAAFTVVIGGLVYKLLTAKNKLRGLEAKRALVAKYKRYSKLGMFAILFPLACNNDNAAITEFCTHVALQYRTVSGIADMFGDISDVVSDVTDWLGGDDEDDEYGPVVLRVVPEAKTAAPTTSVPVKKGCIHANDCPAFKAGYVVSDYTKSCNTACGGHHCVHFSDCNPDSDEKHPQCVRRMQMERDPMLDRSDDEHESGLPNPGLLEDNEEKLYSPRLKTAEEVDAGIESSRTKFEQILAAESEAREKLLRGETHFGLGYARDSKKLSGTWRRLKYNIIAWFNISINTTVLFGYMAWTFIRMNVIKYRWWLAGGAGLVAGILATWGAYSYFSDYSVVEGGKKRNKGGKKDRGDMKHARDAISTARAAPHGPSGKSRADQDVMWRQRMADREEEDKEWLRRNMDEEELLADKYVRGEECKRFTTESEVVDLSTCSREKLLSLIRETQKKWFDKSETDAIKKRRETLKNLFVVINHRFPKSSSEQLRPGKLPYSTPVEYLIKAYYENREPGYCTGFPYADSLFIPRHGVSGASKVCVVVGSVEKELPDKCVIIRDGVDQVMYPLPAGLKQNSQMKFRAPKKGELVTLFWIRSQAGGKSTQAQGVIGNTRFIGKDHSLEVVEFDGSSEDGACGGIYISGVDGYCLGIHGIGANNNHACPEFYPMSAKWIEAIQKAKSQKPTYLNVEDTKYFDLMDDIINNRGEMKNLNY